MTLQQSPSPIRSVGDIHIWKHGTRRMPDWLKKRMAGGIAKNGTFKLKADAGQLRVNAGDVVVEKHGEIWVRTMEEVPSLIRDLQDASPLPITNIGPGKASQFGTSGRRKRRSKTYSEKIDSPSRHLPIAGRRPTIEWLPLDMLMVDPAYQRSTENDASRKLIIHIAAKFDWRLCPPLVISRRADGSLVIIDGQHRWLAARRRGDLPDLPCCVFTYENIEEEARMFILANRSRKPMSRLDDYFAALAAADEDALEIQQLVKDAGLKVTRTTSQTALQAGEITFTASIAKAIRNYGPEVASAALTNMAVAFSGQKMTHGASIFGGLIKILSVTPPDFDPDELVSALQARTAEQWGAIVVRLKGGDVRATALQKAFMEAYRRHA